MKRKASYSVLVLLTIATLACSGGGDAPSVTTPGPGGSFTASFTADEPAPGNNTVNLSPAPGGGGNIVTVNVGVTGVNDVFGASFRLTYDPGVVTFENWSAGSFIEGSGNTVLYQVSVVTHGVVEVGASCAACAVGENASGTETLIQLLFRTTAAGTSPVSFVASDLLNSQSPPAPIGGLSWAGGTVVSQ